MRITRIIVYLIIFIVSLGFYQLYSYLDEGLEAQTLQATEESMVDQVHLLAALLEHEIEDGTIHFEKLQQGFEEAKQKNFEAKIYRKLKKNIGTNFYLVDLEGIVLYDSSISSHIGEDFSSFLDVKRTLDGRYGARSSRADEDDPTSSVMYIGAPITYEDEIIGAVSLYKKQKDISSFIEGRRKWIITSLSFIGFGIGCFTIAIFVWLFLPLGKLTAYARAIRDGKRPQYPSLGKGREVNTLGKALHEMRESIEGRQYLEQYVQMLTHELKSPLSAIRGAAELLDEEMPREQRRKFLSNIRSETQRSQQIIDGLLKLSKLESMKQLDTNEHHEIKPIIDAVIGDFKHLLEQHQVQLNVETSDFHTFHGERMSLEVSLSNILKNAIDFSSKGDQINITTTESDSHLIITISDQGPGIPDYAKERVFENFYSIARPGTNKKSSGLGLAFVREVANLHHGSAKVENLQAGGAKVTLTIQKQIC